MVNKGSWGATSPSQGLWAGLKGEGWGLTKRKEKTKTKKNGGGQLLEIKASKDQTG